MVSIILLLASIASASSEWNCEAVPFTGQSPYCFYVDNPDYDPSQPEHLKRWELIKKPIGGYIGDIIVKDEAAIGTTARLRVFEVLQKDFLPPAKEKTNPEWFKPMGIYNPRAPVRKLLYEHTWEVKSVPYKVPVILRDETYKMSRCVFDLIDKKSGKVLYSSVPAEVYQSENGNYWQYQNNAWVFSKDETAHHKINEIAKISFAESLSQIPGGWDRLLNVKAIWIDEETDISAETLRRLMLSGGWIFGSETGLAPHLQRLGMSCGPVLGGGIVTLEKDSSKINMSYANSRFKYTDFRSYSRNDVVKDVLGDQNELFSQIRKPYLWFTFIVTLVYAAGSTVLLPVLFVRLKGVKRVELWWKTPVIILAYTVLTGGLGWFLIQPKAPVSDVNEYRVGYSDWPEVFCNVNTAVFKYGAGSMGWKYPESTVVTYVDGDAKHFAVDEGDDLPGRLSFIKPVRGMQTLAGFCYMKEMRQPFSASVSNKTITVSSDRAVRNVHIAVSKSEWIELGSIPAGGSIEVPANVHSKQIYVPNSIFGSGVYYGNDHIMLAPSAAGKACTNCGRVHGDDSCYVFVFDGSVFLVAVDENDMPAVSGLDEKQEKVGRVAWIAQVPLKGYEKGSSGK